MASGAVSSQRAQQIMQAEQALRPLITAQTLAESDAKEKLGRFIDRTLEAYEQLHREQNWTDLLQGVERRGDETALRHYLAAREWGAFGVSVLKGAAALGDVLVFKRNDGGHVGLYVDHDASAFHVLGGNQSDRVSISKLSKQRLLAVRRPVYRAQPANVRPIAFAASGSLSVNEA